MGTLHAVCSHGNNELNPWLAVDLGVPIYVDSVDVLGRSDCCGEYVV